MSAYPRVSNVQVETAMKSTALDLGAAGRDKVYGWGRVDAAGAVQAALVLQANAPESQPPVAAVAAPVAGTTVSGVVAVDVAASDNVGVVKVELRVNGTLVGTDTGAPVGFAWDSTGTANGSAMLVATAYDAAGNSAS